ncbi:MAG: tetratricopeptide repeat protein [Phycisphaerales bacterium]|nr:tetratricopeptide repeat protein [Phycisphaerales bacterium]
MIGAVHNLAIWTLLLLMVACSEGPATSDAPVDRAGAMETLRTAQRYIDAGQFDEAQAILVTAQTAWPEDPLVHEQLARVAFGRGLTLRAQGQLDLGDQRLAQALEHWRRACDLSPDNAAMRVSAADVAAMIGQTSTARALYGRALELDPRAARAALCLAQIEMTAHPDRAEALLQQALEHGGEIPEAHASLSMLHMRRGDETAARAAMATALEAGGDMPGIRVMQARLERLSGAPDRGVELLVALGPQSLADVGTTWELAACWEALDHWDRAAQTWELCFGANAHRSDAGTLALNAARAWEAAGDGTKAQSWFRQARLLGVDQEGSSASP